MWYEGVVPLLQHWSWSYQVDTASESASQAPAVEKYMPPHGNRSKTQGAWYIARRVAGFAAFNIR